MADPKQSRGYRNKNPGNLNYIADPKRAWNGQVGLGDKWLPQEQRRFGEYETHEMGIRAMVGQLVVNQTRYGMNTIAKQIRRWAPEFENDTSAYIQGVAKRAGVGATAPIDVRRHSIAKPLVEAIISYECGGMPYSPDMIDAGLELYGITRHSEPAPITTTAQAAATPAGVSTLSMAGVGAAVTAVAPALQALGGLSPWTVAILAGVTLICGAVWLLRKKVEPTPS